MSQDGTLPQAGNTAPSPTSNCRPVTAYLVCCRDIITVCTVLATVILDLRRKYLEIGCLSGEALG